MIFASTWSRRGWLPGGLIVALVATLGIAEPVAATPPPATPPAAPDGWATGPNDPAAVTDPASDPTFTLITGDVVRMVTAPDGSISGEVVHDAGRPGDVVFQQFNEDYYALPGEAVRMIAEGRLDMELFNLTKLAEYGYDDAGADAVPVITTYDQPADARSGAIPLPQGARHTGTLRSIDAQTLRIAKDEASEAWVGLTDTRNPIERVWLDAKAEISLDVSAPAIGAPAAWRAGYDGTGVRVAVLDTGIDADHPDFAGRIAAMESFVPGEDIQDLDGHGTHVASIAAGSGAASDGTYTGAAPGADLVVGKVCGPSGCPNSAVIAGMEWAAVEQDATVVNLSLGGLPTDGTDPVSQAVDELSEKTGALFVVAAGNAGANNAFMQVGTPAAADSALAVGNVAKTDPYELSPSSSWGPRVNDYAIKPEITAPGTGIIAARAAEGVIGEHVDDDYTRLSGTSMATPHVTGAAALLAQQHPDWTGRQLKDALVSTSNPHPQTPITAQGAGMVDVSRATTSPLVATGTLNLGVIEPPYDPTNGTITLRNPTNQSVHVDLTLADLVQNNPARRGVTPYTLPDGGVTVTPAAVEVPAGGTAAVQVTVEAAAFDTVSYYGASYYGRIEARADGGDLLARTTLSWTKSPELHRLTVRGIDRTGAPAHTTCCSRVSLINLDTATLHPGIYNRGQAYFAGLGYDPLLPEGRYAVLSNISDWTLEPPFTRLSETLGGNPELVLDGDTELVIDAREARPVRFETPLPAEPVAPGIDVTLRRVLGEPQAEDLRFHQQFDQVRTPYVIATEGVTTGTFSVSFGTRLAAEDLTMTIPGAGALKLSPQYVHTGTLLTGLGDFGRCVDAGHIGCVPPFDSRGSYQVVDAGSGTPAELAAAAGQLAFVREDVPRDSLAMDEFLAAATAAGVAGVLYAVSDPGPPERLVRERAGVPAAAITRAEGDRLATKLADGAVTVRTGGEFVSPYIYDLCLTENGQLPEDTVYEFDHKDLATVTAHYHADTAGLVYREWRTALEGCSGHLLRSMAFEAPFSRTEYLTPGSWWHSTDFAQVSERDELSHYEAGDRITERHLGTPITPRLSAVSARTSSLLVSGSTFSTPPWFDLGSNFGTAQIRVRRDGELLCERTRIGPCSVGFPFPPGRYQVEIETEQSRRPISTATRTVWEVTAGEPLPNVGQPLPAIGLEYEVALSETNAVRSGRPYLMTVSAGYQPEYTGTSRFTVEAWVSYDDGATWTALRAWRTGRDGDARFLVDKPSNGAQFATVRVRATDSAGNSVDQTITRAWRVSPG